MAAKSQLGRMIERGYAAGGRMNLQDIVREIQSVAGSDRKAAALVGVHHRTWQRWRHGQAKPNILHLLNLGTAVRKVRADTRPLNASTLVFKTKGKDGRNRVIRGDQLDFGRSQVAAIEAAYIAQGADGAARQFMAELRATPPGRDFYGEYFKPLAREEEEDLFDELQYEGDDNDMDQYSAGAGSASW